MAGEDKQHSEENNPNNAKNPGNDNPSKESASNRPEEGNSSRPNNLENSGDGASKGSPRFPPSPPQEGGSSRPNNATPSNSNSSASRRIVVVRKNSHAKGEGSSSGNTTRTMALSGSWRVKKPRTASVFVGIKESPKYNPPRPSQEGTSSRLNNAPSVEGTSSGPNNAPPSGFNVTPLRVVAAKKGSFEKGEGSSAGNSTTNKAVAVASGNGLSSTEAKKPRRNPLADSQGPPMCAVCGRRFGSWRAVFGHMRMHNDRQWRGAFPPPQWSADEAVGALVQAAQTAMENLQSPTTNNNDVGASSSNAIENLQSPATNNYADVGASSSNAIVNLQSPTTNNADIGASSSRGRQDKDPKETQRGESSSRNNSNNNGGLKFDLNRSPPKDDDDDDANGAAA